MNVWTHQFSDDYFGIFPNFAVYTPIPRDARGTCVKGLTDCSSVRRSVSCPVKSDLDILRSWYAFTGAVTDKPEKHREYERGEDGVL